MQCTIQIESFFREIKKYWNLFSTFRQHKKNVKKMQQITIFTALNIILNLWHSEFKYKQTFL